MKKFNLIFISNLLGIFWSSITLKAIAQGTSNPNIQYSEEVIKTIIVGVFVLIIIILFLICVGIIILSNNEDKKNFAFDTVKGLNGFFIGAITGWLA